MRKILSCIPVILTLLMIVSLPSAAQEIRSVDVTVYINEEGDAYVEQVWDVNVVSGTEWYIPIENLDGMAVRGLSVKENGNKFIQEGNEWDSDRSLAQKAGRCGIIEKGRNAVELCWGMGSYGDHVWTAGFTVLGLVQSLEDYDAFNFMFINPGMMAPPQRASVTFMLLQDGAAFTSDNTLFWFFGSEGNSELREDGTIRFETSSPMSRDGSVICMMRFERGLFKPSAVKKSSFQKMQKKAFKGSSYEGGSGGGKSVSGIVDFGLSIIEIILIAAFALVLIGIPLLFLFAFIKDLILKATGRMWSPKFFGSSKIEGWERRAPFGGSIPVATFLLDKGHRLMVAGSHNERSIGAYFLKWIQDGIVVPVKAADGHYDMQFPEASPKFGSKCEEKLYQRSLAAAGENRILEKGEFDSWAKKNYRALAGLPDSISKEGERRYDSFSGDKTAEAAKLLKFRNYLKEFTLSGERAVPEVSLWGEYLIFAQVFGMADKVAKGFAKMYPDQFSKFSQQHGLDTDSMVSVVQSWTYTGTNAYKIANQEKIDRAIGSSSSSGHGGSSSIGGGGGFSGGGFGGGSR